MIRTRSPTFAAFSSSCALNLVVRVTILPYTGCGTRRSTATTTVFCILSLTTTPTRVFRDPRAAPPPASRAPGFAGAPGGVFVISAISSPSLPRRLAQAAGAGAAARRRQLALAQNRLQARDVAPDRPQAERVLERLRRAPELEPEPLLLQLRDPRPDVPVGQIGRASCRARV